MSKRFDRSMSEEQKGKISSSLRLYYKGQGVEAKRNRSEKQSEAMKRYWAGIPVKNKETERQDVGKLR